MRPVTQIVMLARSRAVLEGTRGVDWTYDYMTAAEREAFDAYLVAVGHPLAHQAGTQEQRFRAFVAGTGR